MLLFVGAMMMMVVMVASKSRAPCAAAREFGCRVSSWGILLMGMAIYCDCVCLSSATI